jgi:hypothetical protein
MLNPRRTGQPMLLTREITILVDYRQFGYVQ